MLGCDVAFSRCMFSVLCLVRPCLLRNYDRKVKYIGLGPDPRVADIGCVVVIL